MILIRNMYVPSLRWRQGEYQALLRLTGAVKDRIVPFITIPEIEFDFEERRLKKSVHEHVHPFAARFNAKWGKRMAWVNAHKSIIDKTMNDGRAIFTYVFDALRSFEATAIPAIPLYAAPAIVQTVSEIVEMDNLGAAISIRLEDLMAPNPRVQIERMSQSLGVALSDLDLAIDLGAPNFEPYSAFADALISALHKLGDLSEFRNFILIATAMPDTFKNIAKGADTIPRHDWLFYHALVTKIPADMRCPIFGDYTIVHPDFTPIDMRMIKASGKLVYTTSANWEVRKGGAFRDNPEQMHEHCESIVHSGKFKGAEYSTGDDYISKCAARAKGPSNQRVGKRWRLTIILRKYWTISPSLALEYERTNGNHDVSQA